MAACFLPPSKKAAVCRFSVTICAPLLLDPVQVQVFRKVGVTWVPFSTVKPAAAVTCACVSRVQASVSALADERNKTVDTANAPQVTPISVIVFIASALFPGCGRKYTAG